MKGKDDSVQKAEGLAPKGRFAIVVSRFHEHITNRLLDGALDCLRENDAAEIAVYYCPGSFELPQVANTLVKERIWDAIICLGVVIRGETSHFEYVASETARGIQDVALRSGVPVLLGVLTTENEQQALDRAGGKYGNKGRDAALAAVEMGALFEDLKRRREQVQ